MAERPIFVPAPEHPGFVRTLSLPIKWHGGFSPLQKQKNIRELHAVATARGYTPALEISTKSEELLGRRLSAFHLKVHSDRIGDIPLESAFQGSKIFEKCGPNTDLYNVEPRIAKRDPRLRNSGRIVGFSFDGVDFPNTPRTAFYDWLYINAIFEYRDWLGPRLSRYAAFTDIEFNPQKSDNCQARSCALFAALLAVDLLDGAVDSPTAFLEVVSGPIRDVGKPVAQQTGLFPR